MKILRVKDYREMSRTAANIISAQVILKPECVLGLATGSSPEGTYRQLVEWYGKGDLDFSRVTTVNLDEYKGLTADHEQSYARFMHRHLFDHVNVDPARTFLPDGSEPDSERACADYDAVIERVGGVDLQLLGLGRNGHIGFNEPDSAFAPRTHCVRLTASTIEANRRFFERAEDVPREAYTMGIGTILRAKKILVVVSGEDKAEALRAVCRGPVTPSMPGSILQFHPDVTIVADEAALSRL